MSFREVIVSHLCFNKRIDTRQWRRFPVAGSPVPVLVIELRLDWERKSPYKGDADFHLRVDPARRCETE
jgi:hypothetical protein